MNEDLTRRLIRSIDEQYGITSDLIGNGCEHGFKPAASCPNVDCPDRQLHTLWNEWEANDR